jgi:hypothetical protein
VLGDIVRSPHKQKPLSRAYTRAGVRAVTYFDPAKVRYWAVCCMETSRHGGTAFVHSAVPTARRSHCPDDRILSPLPPPPAPRLDAQVKAAIVTCGGLCPGLNNVIREVVDTLYYCYGVDTIIGVQNGYWGE